MLNKQTVSSQPLSTDEPLSIYPATPLTTQPPQPVATISFSKYDSSTLWITVPSDNEETCAVSVGQQAIGICMDNTRIRLGDHFYDVWLEDNQFHMQWIWQRKMQLGGIARTLTQDQSDWVVLSWIDDEGIRVDQHVECKWSVPMFDSRYDIVIGRSREATIQIPACLAMSSTSDIPLVSGLHCRVCERAECVGDLTAVIRDGSVDQPSRNGIFVVPSGSYAVEVGTSLLVDNVKMNIV